MLPHDYPPIVDSKTARFRLLYVGDDIEMLGALRKILTMPDYHIVSCPHVGSAILLLEGDPRYDLLMFESELRATTGVKLARQARSIPHRSHLPMVMITTTELVRHPGKLGRKSGVNHWVSKHDIPVFAETIITLLESRTGKTNASSSLPGTASS
jgi:response regulator RpfG family c-di-GMP phosphodiesterase